MNKDKKAILITAALLLVLCLGAVLGYQKFAPKGVAGEKLGVPSVRGMFAPIAGLICALEGQHGKL